jgi:hypothetical protein
VIGHKVTQEGRPPCHPHPTVGGYQVLQQEGHARKGSRGHFAGGRGARLFIHRRDHRVKGGIQTLDPLDGRVHELDRLDLPPPHQLGLGGGIEEGDVIQFRHGSPPFPDRLNTLISLLPLFSAHS